MLVQLKFFDHHHDSLVSKSTGAGGLGCQSRDGVDHEGMDVTNGVLGNQPCTLVACFLDLRTRKLHESRDCVEL
jgi:hypothetical protein